MNKTPQGQTTKAVVFDVFGTLFSLDLVKHRIMKHFGLPPVTVEFWWSQTVRDAEALTLSGDYQPFSKILEENLKRTVLAELQPSGTPLSNPSSPEFCALIKDILDGLHSLELKKGVIEALQLWKENGWKIYCLSNGSKSSVTELLKHANAENLVDDILSCDDVKKSKPHPDTYSQLKKYSGFPDNFWFVASHAWDLMGSKKAGMKTIFLNDFEKHFPSMFPEPDYTTKNLRNAAEFCVKKE